MYKAVICDLDGTLLDTLEDLASSMNGILEEMGFPAHPTYSYRYFVGDGIQELARRVLPESQRDEKMIEDCIAGMMDRYRRSWNHKTSPYPGILELLDTLKERGVGLAVFSNKPHEFTTLMVDHYFPPHTFAMVIGVGGDIPRKPDPKGVAKILASQGWDPGEAIFLGDTRTDMETALNAELYPVGVLWGFRDKEELLKTGALAVLERPFDLLPILEGKA